MGNGVTTDSIKQSKYDAKVAKEQAKQQAKNAEQKKEAEKQAAARDLVNSLAGSSDADKAKKIRGDVKDTLEQMYKDGQITKAQYKEAKSFANSGDFKEGLQSELDSDARILVAGVAGKAEGTSIGKVKDSVKDGLKAKLDNKEITQDEYDNAKKYSKTGTWIGRFFGKQEKESRQMFDAKSNRNNVDQTKANGPVYDAKLQAKLNMAGITTEQVYELLDNNGGAADGEINYSYKKKQPGEQHATLTKFNQIAKEKGLGDGFFSKKETNKIADESGYEVGKSWYLGKAVEAGVKTAAPVSPIEFGKISASAVGNAAANVGSAGSTAANATASVLVKSGGILTGAAFLTGAGVSIYNQTHRVEDRAIPTDVPKGVTTYEQYTNYLQDNYSTASNAQLGKDLAKQFTKDGKLDVDGLNAALKKAAGTVDSTSTPLNKKEVLGALMNAASQEKKAEPVKEEKVAPAPVVVAEPQDCAVKVKEEQVTETKAVPTDCYKVKSGDNWYAVAKAKYGASDADAVVIARKLKDQYFEANKETLTKVGINSSKGAFFAKVGDELCVPTEVNINGKTYTYNADAAVQAGEVSKDYKGATVKGNGNIFTKTVTNTIYKGQACDGTDITGKSREEIQSKVDELQKQHPDKKYVITQ